jgi:hypothetical protein
VYITVRKYIIMSKKRKVISLKKILREKFQVLNIHQKSRGEGVNFDLGPPLRFFPGELHPTYTLPLRNPTNNRISLNAILKALLY